MSQRIEPGIYKARGVEGSAQHGHSKNGTEQVTIDLELPALGKMLSTFLYFSDDAAPYALERLRALGWEGGDDPSFPGISRNEVDVQVKYEMYEGAEKLKVDIVTGGGRVVMKNTMNDQQKRGFMSRISKLDKQSGTAPTQQSANSNTRKMAL
jgi:hypothetical protein